MSKVVQLVNSLTHDGHEFKEGKKFRKTPHHNGNLHSKRSVMLKWFIGILIVLAAITITIYFLVRHYDVKHPYQPHIYKHGNTIHHPDLPATSKIGDVLLTDTTTWEPTQYSFGDTVRAVYKPVSGYPLTGERIFQFIMNDVVAYHHTTLENQVTFTIPIQEAISNTYFHPDVNCFMQVLLPSGDQGHYRVQSKKVTVGYGLRWVPGTYGSDTEKVHTVSEGDEVELQLQYQGDFKGDVFTSGSWTISRSEDKKTFTSVKVMREVVDTARKIISVYFNANTIGTFYYRVTYSKYSVVNDIIAEKPLTISKASAISTLIVYTTSFTTSDVYYPTEELFPTVLNPSRPDNLFFEYNPDSDSGVWTHINQPPRKKDLGSFLDFKGYYVKHTLQPNIYRPRYRIRARDGPGGTILADSGDFKVQGEVKITNVPSTVTIYTDGSHTDTSYPIVVKGLPDFETYKDTWTSPLRFRVELDLGSNKYILSNDTTLQGFTHLNINFNAIRSVQAAGTTYKNAILSIHLLNNLEILPIHTFTIPELQWVKGYSTVTTTLQRYNVSPVQYVRQVQSNQNPPPVVNFNDQVIVSALDGLLNYTNITTSVRFSENSEGTKQISFDTGSGIYYYWIGNDGTDVKLVKSDSEYTGDKVDWTPIVQTIHENAYKIRYGTSQYIQLSSIGFGVPNPTQFKAVLTSNIDNATTFIAGHRLATE